MWAFPPREILGTVKLEAVVRASFHQRPTRAQDNLSHGIEPPQEQHLIEMGSSF
jgi:hypothetical protein